MNMKLFEIMIILLGTINPFFLFGSPALRPYVERHESAHLAYLAQVKPEEVKVETKAEPELGHGIKSYKIDKTYSVTVDSVTFYEKDEFSVELDFGDGAIMSLPGNPYMGYFKEGERVTLQEVTVTTTSGEEAYAYAINGWCVEYPGVYIK